MKAALTVGVWVYLLVATVTEVVFFDIFPRGFVTNLSIGLLAVSKAVLIVMYYMHLKYEPRPIKYLIVPPTLLVAVLILTLVYSIGH
ncbi:MAG: cytochrome C oxidase subunit IV family protein [Nitrososphaerales archaeon]|nr:cytochrome C oxidase subunit IV family protein [Nitrososphaerales archaeon]